MAPKISVYHGNLRSVGKPLFLQGVMHSAKGAPGTALPPRARKTGCEFVKSGNVLTIVC